MKINQSLAYLNKLNLSPRVQEALLREIQAQSESTGQISAEQIQRIANYLTQTQESLGVLQTPKSELGPISKTHWSLPETNSTSPIVAEGRELITTVQRQTTRAYIQSERLWKRLGEGTHRVGGREVNLSENTDGIRTTKWSDDSREIHYRSGHPELLDVTAQGPDGQRTLTQRRGNQVFVTTGIGTDFSPTRCLDLTDPEGQVQHISSRGAAPLAAATTTQTPPVNDKDKPRDWKKDMVPDGTLDLNQESGSLSDLAGALQCDASFKGAENVAKLFELLGNREDHDFNSEHVGKSSARPPKGPQKSLQLIKQRHGLAKLNEICGMLLKFIQEAKAKGWSDDEAKDFCRYVLADMADPSQVDQTSKGSCGAAAVQMKLAAEKPEVYVKMVTQLALGKPFRAQDGTEIKPNDSWRSDQGDHRRPTDKLMQNALMGLAAQRDGDTYDSKPGMGGRVKQPNIHGLFDPEITALIETLFGPAEKGVDNLFGLLDDNETTKVGLFQSADAVWKKIQDDLARGRVVQVCFHGHALDVYGYDPTSKPPTVHLLSWGQRYTMTLPNFLQNLRAATCVDDAGFDDKKLTKPTKNT